MSHVLSSEAGMPVQRLMEVVESGNCIIVQIGWERLTYFEDTLEQFWKVCADVPQIILKPLSRNKTPVDFVDDPRRNLDL